MRAKDVLLTALQEYTGTVVFVSHDRYFIDRLATRVFEIEDGQVTVYLGNYEDYLWRKQGGGVDAAADVGLAAPVEALVEAVPKAPEKRLNPIKLRQIKERQNALEQEVAHLEEEIAAAETALANFVSIEETRRQTELIESHRSNLAALMAEWEQVAQLLAAHS